MTTQPATPTLAEDLLLLLFQPNSGLRSGTGTIAGEGTLYYVLAGAVLTDLALRGQVRAGRDGRVEAVGDGVERRLASPRSPRCSRPAAHSPSSIAKSLGVQP